MSLFPIPKKRRQPSSNSMEDESAKAKLAAAAEELGREILVFKTSLHPASTEEAPATTDEAPATSTSQNDVPDDFYDFTPDDYYRVISNKMGAQFLKTRKIRDAEEAARRSRITKAIMRVKFPDGYVLEAKFQSSECIQSLTDLLSKVVARPDLPFYIYTTPPKERIKDMTKDFYSAGFAPGAIVYFTYDLPKVDTPPFLREEICSLCDLHLLPQDTDNVDHLVETTATAAPAEPSPVVPESKPASKPAKPKWFKM